MVRVCAIPGCGKRMRSYNPETFHRLPLQEPTLKQWLVVLQLDVETPSHILKQKDYRVCSRHFDAEQFTIPTRGSNPPRRVHLKKNAIPKATVSGCDVSVDLKDPELTAISQFTLKKTPHKDGGRRNGLPVTLMLSLSGSEQTALPRMYLARPPTWQLLKMCSQPPGHWADPQQEDSKMSEVCIVQGCDRTEQLLSFPEDPSALQHWMVLLDGRLKHPVNSSSTICCTHFPPDCFTNWPQQQQAGVDASLTLKPGALPSLFMDVNNEVRSQSLGSIGRQCDLQQKMVTEDGSSKSIPLHAQSKATQTPAVTHVSLGEGLDFLLHPARVVTVQRSQCSVHTTVWASGCEPNSNTSIQGRNGLMSDVVVKIASLLQLFQKCLQCCSDACSVSTRRKGPVLHVTQQCWSCGNSREWTSHPPDQPADQPPPDQQLPDQPPSDHTPIDQPPSDHTPPDQQPLDPAGSPQAEEEPVVTPPEDMAIVMEEEFTIQIDEEDEEEEKIEDEDAEEDEWMEAYESYELLEHEDEEEDEEEEEEEVSEEEVEVKQKPTKRKRKDSDDEWTPDTEKITEASDEEYEGSEGEDDEEENIQVGWCTACGEETSARCLKQKHLQLYCCIKCNEELVSTDGQQTQHTISPESPTAADQEGSCDGSQAAEHSCSPEANSNNKQTASSDRLEDSNSISSEGVIASSSQHATTSGIQEAPSNGVSELASSSAGTHGVCSVREQGSVSSHDQGGTGNVTGWHDPKYAVYFSDVDSLQNHVERFHECKRKRALCPDCGKFILRRLGRPPHVCDHKAKLFLCLTCGQRCVNEVGLRIHSHVHTEEYVLCCQYCYEKFRCRKDKQEHEKTHKGESLKFRCSECPKRFADCASRSAHRKTHWERGRFFCKVCDKGFPQAHHLQRHMAVHTGQKPFRCKLCDCSFNQSGHLKSHMRLHTGERPFKCQDCGQCFNHNVSLKNHIQRKHTPGPEGR